MEENKRHSVGSVVSGLGKVFDEMEKEFLSRYGMGIARIGEIDGRAWPPSIRVTVTFDSDRLPK